MKTAKILLVALCAFLFSSVAIGTVPSSTAWVQYTTTTIPQTMTVPFVFQNTSDLLVLDTRAPAAPVTLTQNSDYSVTGGSGSTGSVTTISGGAHGVLAGDVITITRAVPLTQTTAYTNSGPLNATMIGNSLDKLTAITQQLNLVGARSLQFGPDETMSGVLGKTARKNALLGFDGSGNVAFLPFPTVVTSTQFVTTVPNVASLRTLSVASLASGQSVTTAGYYTANDGGSGLYIYNSGSTATDDGGAVIAAAGGTGRWLLVYFSDILATQYGVTPDWEGGISGTDNTTQLQAAINYCLANRGRKLVLPNGGMKITSPLTVGTNSSGSEAQTSFCISGQGRDSLAASVGAGGSAIVMVGTGKASILNLKKSAYRYLRFENFTLASATQDGAAVGILFDTSADTQFSFHNVRVTGATTSVRHNVGTGANGEFTEFHYCRFDEFTTGYYSDSTQMYGPKFLNCQWTPLVGGLVWNFTRGVGGQIIGNDISFGGITVGDGVDRVIQTNGSAPDTLMVVGGRWEGVDTLIKVPVQGGETANPHISLVGVTATSFQGTAPAIDLGYPTNNRVAIQIDLTDCLFTSIDQNNAPKLWSVSVARSSQATITINRCMFLALTPVVAFAGTANSTWTDQIRNTVTFKDCLGFDNTMQNAMTTFPINKVYRSEGINISDDRSARPLVPQAGRMNNLLLQSNFGEPGSNGTATSPWVHTGTAHFLGNTGTLLDGSNPREITPLGWSVEIDTSSGVYQNVTAVNVTTATSKKVIYQARAAFRSGGNATFAFTNTSSGRVYDQTTVRSPGNGGYIPTFVHLEAFIPPSELGNLRLSIATDSADSVQLLFSYQFVSDQYDAIFAPTTSGTVVKTQGWDAQSYEAKVMNRLQIPYKTDASMAGNSNLAEPEAEIYQSSTTELYRMYFPTNTVWGALPKQDVGSAAPVSGTWVAGWIRWNTAPAASGTVGWVCTTGGTPGTWKTFGAIAP